MTLPTFWKKFTIFTIFDNFDIFWQFLQFWHFLTIMSIFQSFWRFLWPETWHLRHWLHFWQLRRTIWTITLWSLNTEWWWQHSQFLPCFLSSGNIIIVMADQPTEATTIMFPILKFKRNQEWEEKYFGEGKNWVQPSLAESLTHKLPHVLTLPDHDICTCPRPRPTGASKLWYCGSFLLDPGIPEVRSMGPSLGN